MTYFLQAGSIVFLLLLCLLVLSIYVKYLCIVFVVVFGFVLYFFREADLSNLDTNNNTFISPCQGTIMKINTDETSTFVSIFLSPFDVHVQYTPVDSVITNQVYKSGEFYPAYMFEKSKFNERMETTFYNETFGEYKLTQIAGIFARRIVSFNKINDKLPKGTPFGLIRFGSRIDISIKKKINLKCKEGQKVYVGDVLGDV
jgi:phosphatidylserine decarboxylase